MRREIHKEFIRANRRSRKWYAWGVEPPLFTAPEIVLVEADGKKLRKMLAMELELVAMRDKLKRRQRYNQVKAARYGAIAAALGKLLASTAT